MTVAQRTVEISELLENILLNLSTSDILCGAQSVSKLWRECLHGSVKLKKKCFLLGDVLNEKDTDSRLFLDLSCPAYSKHLRESCYNSSGSFKKLVPPHEITPANFRQAFLSDPSTLFTHYQFAVEGYIGRMESWNQTQFQSFWDKMCVNSGTTDFGAACSLLNTSCLHPYLGRYWKGKESVIWGGYGHHIVFWLGHNSLESRYIFQEIRTFFYATIEALYVTERMLMQQLTIPATKKLTVALRLPGLRLDKGQYVGHPSIAQRESGITMYDLLKLLIPMMRSAIENHDEDIFHGFLTMICQNKSDDVDYEIWMERYTKEMELISQSLITLEGILAKQGYNEDLETRNQTDP